MGEISVDRQHLDRLLADTRQTPLPHLELLTEWGWANLVVPEDLVGHHEP